jgi:hypothetical protein
MGISFLKKKRFSPFERRFPYAFAMKFQRAHWLGNFACTRVEITCARDTKIEVIDCEFPLCISPLCDGCDPVFGNQNGVLFRFSYRRENVCTVK